MPWSTPDLFSATAALCFGVILPWAQRVDAETPPVLRWLALAGLPFLVLAAGWERGLAAALLAAPACVYALWLFAHGAGRFLANMFDAPAVRWLEALSSSGPLVAAAAWVWSRWNSQFAGFPEPLATLTVVHFAITFSVLPAAMTAWTRTAPPKHAGLRHLALWIYLASAPLTALCFALRENVLRPGLFESVFALLFAAGFVLWWVVIGQKKARWLASPLLIGFALGAGYTVTGHFDWPYLNIPQMFAIHGLLNLLGTLLLASRAPVRPAGLGGPPAPDTPCALNAGSEQTASFVDQHQYDLGPWSEAGFARVRDALLGYDFYPETVLRRRTQFEMEGRPVRVGDRIGLALRLPNLPGLAPVELPALVEVQAAESGADWARFGYRTTTRHYARGAWRAEVRRDGDRLRLEVRSHVRPAHPLAWLGLPVFRHFQKAAFRAALARLKSLV